MNVISAYMLINKAIPSTGGPYTVRFYDDDNNLIQTDANVPQYGDAHCTLLDGSIVDGLYFKGWNPSPTVVTRNLDCYPSRGDYIINHEEIRDSWETICRDRGAHYPLSSYKSLVVSIPSYTFDYDFKYWNGNEWVDSHTESISAGSVSVALDMVKVAEGEDNSVSTWLSTGVIYIAGNVMDSGKRTGAYGVSDANAQYTSDWGNSAIRKYLNTHFLENLPASIRDTIVQVTKDYIGDVSVPHPTSIGYSMLNKESLDKIWIPSKKELYTKIKDYTNATWWSGYEANGIDYASVYMPTISTYGRTETSCLRSSGGYNGNRLNNYVMADSMGDPLNGSCGLGGTDGNGKMMFGFCL